MGVLGIVKFIWRFLRLDFIYLGFRVLKEIFISLCCPVSVDSQIQLSGKRIIITGASRGVGEELIYQFVKCNPSRIIVVSRSSHVLQSICRRMNREFPDTKFVHFGVDLEKRQDIDVFTAFVKEQIGFPHVIVCNAGIVTGGRLITEMNDDEYLQTLKVNTLSHYYLVKAFLNDMVTSGEDCQIVQVLSLLSFFSLPRLTPYSCSKAASYLFSEALRGEIEFMTSKIGVTTIHPYLIDTAMFSSVKLKYPLLMAPLKTMYVAQEIVKATINRSHCVVLPKFMRILPFIKSVLPTRAWLQLMSFGDAYSFASSLPNR